MFFAKKLQDKGCLFPKNCKRKGIVSEIYIAPKKVEKNAKKYSQSIENETLRVVSHGLLHLCGYNDTTNDEAREMRLKEEHYLKLFHSYSK